MKVLIHKAEMYRAKMKILIFLIVLLATCAFFKEQMTSLAIPNGYSYIKVVADVCGIAFSAFLLTQYFILECTPEIWAAKIARKAKAQEAGDLTKVSFRVTNENVLTPELSMDDCKDTNSGKMKTMKLYTAARLTSKYCEIFSIGMFAMGVFWAHFAIVLMAVLGQQELAFTAGFVALGALAAYGFLIDPTYQFITLVNADGKQMSTTQD